VAARGRATNYPLTLSVMIWGRVWADGAGGASIGAKRVCEYMQTALEGLVEALRRSRESGGHSGSAARRAATRFCMGGMIRQWSMRGEVRLSCSRSRWKEPGSHGGSV